MKLSLIKDLLLVLLVVFNFGFYSHVLQNTVTQNEVEEIIDQRLEQDVFPKIDSLIMKNAENHRGIRDLNYKLDNHVKTHP